jgi:hypothetical protein
LKWLFLGRRGWPLFERLWRTRTLGLKAVSGWLANGELVIIDGGTGGQPQAEGVPMGDNAWCARRCWSLAALTGQRRSYTTWLLGKRI